MTKRKGLISTLVALMLLCTFALGFSLFTVSADTVEGTELEETHTPSVETELVSTNPYDLITFTLTDSTGAVLLETNDLKQYATSGGSELFYEKMTVSIPVNFLSNDYVIFRFAINFDACKKLDNIETFKKFNLEMSNFFIYKQGATTPSEIRFSGVNSLSDIYDKSKENVSFKVSPSYFTYERPVIEGASIEDQKGEIVFYNTSIIFNSGDKGAVTFDLVSYAEIEKREVKEETPGPADKVEDKLNEAGSKFSEWLESNTGVAVGGTTGLLVLVVLGIVVVRLIKRRR